ncbi:MAG: ribosome silencing factor [Armatimonadota bacterium]
MKKSPERAIDTQDKLRIIQEILREKKAEDVEVIEVGKRTLVADYFVIASGTSNTHIKAIADGLVIDGKSRGVKKDRIEGYKEATWVLVDYGDIVVHIFAPEERAYYDIESLWKETAVRLQTSAG